MTSSSSSDWHPVDQHNVCLPTIVSSTDLFDGELFGDELLDIYNSAVVDGQIHAADVDPHDIPHLLDGHDGKARDDHDPSHPGVQIAHVAAAIDDGLGAFRPSTSFNDLTTLLGPGGEPVATAAAVAQVSVPSSPTTSGKPTKKRKSLSTSTGPADPSTSPPKKRGGSAAGAGGGARGGRKASPKKQAAAPSSQAPIATVPMVTTTVVSHVAVATSTAAAAAAAAAAPSVPAPATSVPAKAKAVAGAEDDTPNPLVLGAAVASQSTPKAAAPVVVSNQSRPPLPLLPVSPEGKDCASDDEEPDEEFTKMAQAAVSSLIASAGKEGAASASAAGGADEKVDTSTDHIKALTGNNWVQACSGGVSVEAPPSPTMSDPKNAAAANNRVRRQNLTADERARQNRDRNREHARNTRLRKKAYVEELKRTLIELVAQRDATEFEKRQSAQREMEQREVRFRVMEEFLKLRGRNEASAARWSAILEDGFTFTIPMTTFRKMVSTNRESISEQVLEGVGQSMADSSHFSSFLQGLGSTESPDSITFQYQVDRKNFFMDGCTGLLDWEGSTVGAVKKGAMCELKLKGTIRGTFSPASNKLLTAVMSFDTGVVVSQLRTLSGGMNEENVALAAAHAAASQADAILDSLQMPMVPVPVAVVVPSSSSDTSSDKGEVSCDDSESEAQDFHNTTSATASQVIAGRSG